MLCFDTGGVDGRMYYLYTDDGPWWANWSDIDRYIRRYYWARMRRITHTNKATSPRSQPNYQTTSPNPNTTKMSLRLALNSTRQTITRGTPRGSSYRTYSSNSTPSPVSLANQVWDTKLTSRYDSSLPMAYLLNATPSSVLPPVFSVSLHSQYRDMSSRTVIT